MNYLINSAVKLNKTVARIREAQQSWIVNCTLGYQSQCLGAKSDLKHDTNSAYSFVYNFGIIHPKALKILAPLG